MSKFTDRLKRLHSSRVRALEESDDGEQKRVFTADEVSETAVERAARVQTASDPQRSSGDEDVPQREVRERPSSPARDAVREKLEISRRVGANRRPKKLEVRRAGDDVPPPRDFDDESSDTRPAPRIEEHGSSNPIGERLTDLRIQANALIEAGRVESALPLLHEMVAISPNNPYPLKQLARYWADVGDHALADLYQKRLASVAPY